MKDLLVVAVSKRAFLMTLFVILLGLGIPSLARAQEVTFNNGAFKLQNDNDANQGSPSMAFNASTNYYYLYYVQHVSPSTNNNTHIMVDPLMQDSPVATNLTVMNTSQTALTDVSAAYLNNGTIIVGFVNFNGQVTFATSTDGQNFTNQVQPTTSELGTGSAGIATWCAPAITSNGTTAYIATVGTDGYVYISSTTDGQNFTPVLGNGVSVSAYQAISQPSMTMFNGAPYVGFTAPNGRFAVIGNALTNNISYATGNPWGQNNRDGYYAGLSLVSIDGYLYAFGQNTQSSQNLQEMYSSDGVNWTFSSKQLQLRWSPTTWAMNGSVQMVYQDDGDTEMTNVSGTPVF